MTDETERVFADAHGVDDDAIKAGLRWLVRFAAAHRNAKAAVFVPTLPQVEHLSRVLGPDAAKRLERDRSIRIEGITLEVLTEKGLRASYRAGPVLAVWVDDKTLDKLDALRPPGLCAIPWNRADIDGWKANWNPTDIRSGAAGGSEETVGNTVVAAAMASLTDRVNLSTGLAHPSDKAAAYQMFKALKAAGERFVPDEVRAYAVRHGWHPKHARELSDMAQKVIDGKTMRTRGGQMWRTDIVELWREPAAKGDTAE